VSRKVDWKVNKSRGTFVNREGKKGIEEDEIKYKEQEEDNRKRKREGRMRATRGGRRVEKGRRGRSMKIVRE
jgi:hypothetical protein